MATLSAAAVARLALDAGLSATAAARAVAVAKHESGYRTEAHNYNPATGDDSYGLWQINYGAGRTANMRAGRIRKYGPPEGMLDPAKNAAAMADLSGRGFNWGPWSGNRSVTRADLAEGAAAVKEAQGAAGRRPTRDVDQGGNVTKQPWMNLDLNGDGTVTPDELFNADNGIDWSNVTTGVEPGGSVLPGAGNLGGFLDWTEGLGKLLTNVTDPAWWLRVGTFALGVGLVLLGVALAFKDTTAGQAATAALKGGPAAAAAALTD